MKSTEGKELNEKRGEIVTNFSYIESLIKKFISLHYFSTAYHPIVSEIFEDEYFSFGLLFKIFEKILDKEKIKFPLNKLRRLGQLRNIVAHAEVNATATGFSTEEITHIFFRHGGVDKEIGETFKEYDEKRDDVTEALKELLKPGVVIEQIPERKKENQ